MNLVIPQSLSRADPIFSKPHEHSSNRESASISRNAALALALFLSALLAPGHVLAESKHFQASQRHFEDMAAMAATLSSQVESPGEKNLCNFFTATAMTYAVRAHVMAQLCDVQDNLHDPAGQAFIKTKIKQSHEYVTRHVESDLKTVEGLAATSGNSRIKRLGLRLANELRVFEHNSANASTG